MDKNLPVSNYLRSFYEENGWDFTDFERAALYWNSYAMLQSEINKAIREIADNTDDETLREQIIQRLEYDEACLKRFRDNSDKKSIYITRLYDDESGIEYFTSLDKAIAYSCKETIEDNDGRTYPLKYIRIFKQEFADGMDIGYTSAEEYIKIDLEGNIVDYNVYRNDLSGEERRRLEDKSRFENTYVCIHSPFDVGDIVRCEGDTDGFGLMAVSKEQWEEYNEAHRSGKNELDYDDDRMVIYHLEEGHFNYAHFRITELEKAEPQDEKALRLLKAAQKIMRGESQDIVQLMQRMDKYRK